MSTPDFETVTGVKLLTLVPGFLGAALSLSYAKDLSRKQAVIALTLGAAVAVYGAPLLMQWLPGTWPPALERCFAFFLGLFAMPVVPMAQAAISDPKNWRMPWTKD